MSTKLNQDDLDSLIKSSGSIPHSETGDDEDELSGDTMPMEIETVWENLPVETRPGRNVDEPEDSTKTRASGLKSFGSNDTFLPMDVISSLESELEPPPIPDDMKGPLPPLSIGGDDSEDESADAEGAHEDNNSILFPESPPVHESNSDIEIDTDIFLTAEPSIDAGFADTGIKNSRIQNDANSQNDHVTPKHSNETDDYAVTSKKEKITETPEVFTSPVQNKKQPAAAFTELPATVQAMQTVSSPDIIEASKFPTLKAAITALKKFKGYLNEGLEKHLDPMVTSFNDEITLRDWSVLIKSEKELDSEPRDEKGSRDDRYDRAFKMKAIETASGGSLETFFYSFSDTGSVPMVRDDLEFSAILGHLAGKAAAERHETGESHKSTHQKGYFTPSERTYEYKIIVLESIIEASYLSVFIDECFKDGEITRQIKHTEYCFFKLKIAKA